MDGWYFIHYSQYKYDSMLLYMYHDEAGSSAEPVVDFGIYAVIFCNVHEAVCIAFILNEGRTLP